MNADGHDPCGADETEATDTAIAERLRTCSAADVCTLIISRLDAAPIGGQAGIIYTYGARPGDIELVPPPTRTTIVLAAAGAARWFEVAVREIDPAHPDLRALVLDPEIMTALSHRANVSPPPGPFG
jgi:hypothetical protein